MTAKTLLNFDRAKALAALWQITHPERTTNTFALQKTFLNMLETCDYIDLVYLINNETHDMNDLAVKAATRKQKRVF